MGQGAPAGSASDPDAPAHSEWGNLIIRYAAVTLICVVAFTLIFLKCWRDVAEGSASSREEEEEPADASEDGDTPAEEDDSVAVAT